MSLTEFDSRLQLVRSHYRASPWIRPDHDEGPLLRSWQRSRAAGLREVDRVEFDLVGRAALAELDDRHGGLARLAAPELDRLGRALQGSGCAVLLLSPQGTIVERRCDDTAAPLPLRCSTRVGVNLSERCIGTTAPAIALAEAEPSLVGRDAHYCANVRPFFCVAAPLLDPRGQVVGAIDITSFDSVPAFDVFSLVVDTASAIENLMFAPGRERLLVRFHARPELVDTPLGCVIEVDEAGRISGANRAATRLLCMARQALVGQAFSALFERDMRCLFPAGHGHDPRFVELHTPHGLRVWAAFGPSADERGTAPPPAPAADAVAPAPSGLSLHELECRTIERTLAELDGNVAATARRLGISRNTVYRRLAERG